MQFGIGVIRKGHSIFFDTPLFDNNNSENSATINYYIQQNFLKIPLSIPDDLQPFLTPYATSRLIGFLRFNKAFVLMFTKPKLNLNYYKLTLIQYD